VDNDLPSFFDSTNQPIGVGISASKKDLKEQDQRRPDSRRAAKPGKDEFAYHRLDLEEKKCGKENAEGKKNH
jgi:hypothetical protein